MCVPMFQELNYIILTIFFMVASCECIYYMVLILLEMQTMFYFYHQMITLHIIICCSVLLLLDLMMRWLQKITKLLKHMVYT